MYPAGSFPPLRLLLPLLGVQAVTGGVPGCASSPWERCRGQGRRARGLRSLQSTFLPAVVQKIIKIAVFFLPACQHLEELMLPKNNTDSFSTTWENKPNTFTRRSAFL